MLDTQLLSTDTVLSGLPKPPSWVGILVDMYYFCYNKYSFS